MERKFYMKTSVFLKKKTGVLKPVFITGEKCVSKWKAINSSLIPTKPLLNELQLKFHHQNIGKIVLVT